MKGTIQIVGFLRMFLVLVSIMYASGAGTVLAAGEISKLVLSKNSLSMEIGDSQALTATALFVNGSSEEVTIKTDWVSSNEAVASVYAGSVTAKSEGTAVITASYMGQTVIVNVNVSKKIRALGKDKQSISIRKQEKTNIGLTAYYSDGSSEDVTNKAEWTIDNYSVATVINGEVTGQNAGTATITAKYGSQSITIPVSVELVRRLDLSKSKVELFLKGSETVTLSATFADGTIEDVTDKAEWSSDNESVADAIKGVITSYGTGTATITAKYGLKTVSLKVESGVSRKLEASQTSLFLKAKESEKIKLTSTLPNGTSEDVTEQAEWTSSNENVAFVNKGTIFASAAGDAVITAAYGGKTATILVDVDVPRKLVANKESVALQAGDSDKVTVKAYFEDGRVEDVTLLAEWSTASATVAEVRQGLVTAVGTGATTVSAKYGNRVVTIPVSVGVVQTLTVDPKSLTMNKEENRKLTLTAKYADGTEKDVSALAKWTSGQAEVVTVDAGNVTAVGQGKTTVTAAFEGKTVTVPVEVDMAQSLSANVRSVILSPGESRQIVVTATVQGGGSKEVTHESEWSSSSPNIASVSKGLVQGMGNGRATITVRYGGQALTIPVEVGIISRLEASKRFISFKTGDRVQVTLTATLSDGSTKDVSKDAEWKTSSYKVADVEDGLVTAVGSGKTTLTARYAGKMISIPIEVDTLKYLKTNVVKLEMRPGETRTVTATATYMDGTESNVTKPALWTTSRILVADVKDGIIKAHGTGTATITVSFAEIGRAHV